MSASTKVCPSPGCGATLARNIKQCACGHQFAKGNANGPKVALPDGAAPPPTREWKGKADKPPERPREKAATPPQSNAEPKPKAFRVGIFNDGGLAILAKLGALELGPEEASELAGFCAQHFGDG